jgi:hypothetical protein
MGGQVLYILLPLYGIGGQELDALMSYTSVSAEGKQIGHGWSGLVILLSYTCVSAERKHMGHGWSGTSSTSVLYMCIS